MPGDSLSNRWLYYRNDLLHRDGIWRKELPSSHHFKLPNGCVPMLSARPKRYLVPEAQEHPHVAAERRQVPVGRMSNWPSGGKAQWKWCTEMGKWLECNRECWWVPDDRGRAGWGKAWWWRMRTLDTTLKDNSELQDERAIPLTSAVRRVWQSGYMQRGGQVQETSEREAPWLATVGRGKYYQPQIWRDKRRKQNWKMGNYSFKREPPNRSCSLRGTQPVPTTA